MTIKQLLSKINSSSIKATGAKDEYAISTSHGYFYINVEGKTAKEKTTSFLSQLDNICDYCGDSAKDKKVIQAYKRAFKAATDPEAKKVYYLIYDEVAAEGEVAVQQVTEKDFYSSLKSNRSIAKEYGDDVENWCDLKSYFMTEKEASESVNGFTYIKTSSRKTYREWTN